MGVPYFPALKGELPPTSRQNLEVQITAFSRKPFFRTPWNLLTSLTGRWTIFSFLFLKMLLLSAEGCSRCNISLAKRHACFVETNACEIDVSRHSFLCLLKIWLHETGFVLTRRRESETFELPCEINKLTKFGLWSTFAKLRCVLCWDGFGAPFCT